MYNKYLDIFIEVADTGSFTKAAEKFFVSPTAIMKQINQMESDLGLKLIIRTHQGVQLTEVGKQIYKDSKHIINYSNRAIQNALKLENNSKNTIITVGTSAVCPCKTLMDIWYEINDQYPNIKIKIVPFEENHTEILYTLTDKKTYFDCIVTPNDSAEWKKNCNFLEIGKTNYVVSVPRNHKFANKKSLSIKDFSNQTIMMVGDGDSNISNMLRDDIIKNNKNVTISPTPFLYDISVFNKCEENGYMLMSLDLWGNVHPGLINVLLKEKYPLPYGIIYSKKPSNELKRFIQIIKARL